MNFATEQLTESQVQTPYQQLHNQHGTSYFDPSTFLEIVIGLHFDVAVFVINCAITDVVTADQNINDKVVRAIKNKFHKFNITLFVAGSLRLRHLVVDAHRVAYVAGQLCQYIHDMIVASSGSHVLFASKHVMALRIKRKVLARAHRQSHSMRFKHQDRRAHGSAKKTLPKVQTVASDRSLSRHVNHPRKRGPVEVRIRNLLFFGRRCRIRRLCIGVDRVGLQKVLIKDRVPLLLWNCWDQLHTLKLQVFLATCERDMTDLTPITLDRHECFQIFIICKRIKNASNTTHYVKLDKTRRESSNAITT